MNLSNEKSPIENKHPNNTKAELKSMEDDQLFLKEEDEYTKEIKITISDYPKANSNDTHTLGSLYKKPPKSNIISEVFQSRINSTVYLDAIWKIEIPSLYFKFTFQEQISTQEERTLEPICFLLKYNEKNYIDVYLQIKDKENFPKEVKEEKDIVHSIGKKDASEGNRTNENGYGTETGNAGNSNAINNENKENRHSSSVDTVHSYRALNDNSAIDFIKPHEQNEQRLKIHNDISTSINNAKDIDNPTQVSHKEYTAHIKIYIIGYCFGIYTFEFNSTETKALRLQFNDSLINDIKNDQSDIIIITELIINHTDQYYQSKSESQSTTYNGLVNQGTTCYMNSLLQILYMLGYFKQSIFQVKILPHQYKTSKIYSMQKLFYDLMSSDNKPISTHHLIVSFGWTKDQMLIQHDVQEFFIILAEIMEKELKGTKEENTFKYLFEGKVMNQIKCINVPFESQTEEKFTDLQLTIKDCANIYDSFDKYTEEELMTGNDQYDTYSHGKQDAKKKIVFSSMPRVLVLQLKRFEYNARMNIIEKINDRFEFYDKLSLSKYIIANDIDKEEVESEYECHAVVVHVGLINNGHYFCYIQPQRNGNWIKFNDERVTIAEHYEVFNNNYGGNLIQYSHTNAENINKENKPNFANAYLLIYIRKDCLNEILVKITKDDVPIDRINVFTLEREERERERMLLARKSLFINVDIITKEIIESNMGNRITGLTENIIELNNLNEDNIGNSNETNKPITSNGRIRLNAHREMLIDTFITIISQTTHVPKHKLYLYKYSMVRSSYLDRYNYTMKCLTEDMYQKKLIDLSYSIEPITQQYYLYIHSEANTPLVCSNHIRLALGKDKEINYTLNIEDQGKDNEVKPDDDNNNNNNIYNAYNNYNNINEELTSIIYYDPKDNDWEFISSPHNSNSNTPINQSKVDIASPMKEKKILIFIKSPIISLNEHNSKDITIQMKLEEVYQMNPKDTLSTINTKQYFKDIFFKNLSKEFKEMIKASYDNSEIQFLLEYCSLSNYFTTENSTFVVNFNLKNSIPFEKYNNDALVIELALNLKQNIPITLLDLLSPLVCPSSQSQSQLQSQQQSQSSSSNTTTKGEPNPIRTLLINSSIQELTKANVNFICKTNYDTINFNKELDLSSTHIDLNLSIESLQQTIIGLIKECLFPKLFKYKASQPSDPDIKYKAYMKNKEYNLIDLFTKDNHKMIHLIPYYNSSSNKKWSYLKFYPLLEYMHPSSNQIQFQINLDAILPKTFPIKTLYKIIICDEYSNPTIVAFFEQEATPYSKTLESYIKDFISQNSMLYSYYFVPYNPYTLIAYDILPSFAYSNMKYEKENHNSRYEIRYQPYPKPVGETKIFICAYANKETPFMMPFCFHCNLRETKVGELKEKILNVLRNNREFKEYKEDVEKVKLYYCSLSNFKPGNFYLIDEKFDEKTAMNVLKRNGAINLCIELTTKNNNNDSEGNNSSSGNGNGNGNNKRNYLKISE